MGAHDSISTTACYLVIMTIASCKKKACKFPKFTMASHSFFSAEMQACPGWGCITCLFPMYLFASTSVGNGWEKYVSRFSKLAKN
jgi:hypothetical protein